MFTKERKNALGILRVAFVFNMFNTAEINRNDMHRTSITYTNLQTGNALSYMSREK